jgi:gliding motility-associated-like protein
LGDVATLSDTSLNGIAGFWNPPLINTSQPGISSYNFTPDPGQCAIDTAISVLVINPTIFAGNDTTLCAGNSLFLEASGGSNYQWSDGVVDGIPFTPTSSTTYTVCGTVGSCIGCDTVVVTVNPAPSASFIQDISGFDVQFLYMGTPVQTYTWDFGDGGNSSLMDPTHSYAGAGNYGVLLTVSNNGCISTYFSEIELFAPGNDAHLINVITPNGDGINDAFDLQLEGYKKVTIHILNRWGNIMQVLTGTQLTWDGMINGNKAVEGVYFYRYETLSYDGETRSGHGFFHLK